MDKCTETTINDWLITTVTDDLGISERWYIIPGVWNIFIGREYSSFDETDLNIPHYRCIIKADIGICTPVNTVGDTPLESFKYARKQLNQLRDMLNNLRG